MTDETVDREIQSGNALEEPQPFRDQDQKPGADRRADRRRHAAEQGHGQKHDRLGEGELIRADIGETAREQPAGQSAQHRAEREGGNLGAEDVDADDAGGKLVVAHRAHGAPEPRIRQMPDEIADHRQHRDAEREIGLRVLEQIGPADPRHPVRAVGEPDRVDHDQRHDLLERDRHHREIVAAEPQRRHAQHRAGHQRHQASRQEAEPIAEVIVRGADADGIGAETEERRLRQIDLAAQAEHDRETEHRDRKRRRLHQDVVDVAVELHRGGERHQRPRRR